MKLFKLNKDKNCPLCGLNPSITKVIDTVSECQNDINAVVESSEIPCAVTCLEAKELIESGAFLVDVREVEELSEGKIPNAVSIPLSTFAKITQDQFPANKPIVLYCKTGRRSLKAVSILSNIGINSCSIAGGITTWKEESLPVQFN